MGGSRYTRSEVFDLDAGVCYLCGEFADWDDFEIEHITSVYNGGDDIIENVAVSHLICNRIKAKRIATECVDIFPNMIIPERWCAKYEREAETIS